MNTLEKIKLHAAEIMANGGPKSKDEIFVVNTASQLIKPTKAGNAGKRKIIKTGK